MAVGIPNRKSALLVLGAVLLLATLAGGFYVLGRAAAVASDHNARKRIVVVLPSSTNPYWLDVRRGAEEARQEVSDFDIEIKVSTGDQDAKAQSFILADLAAQPHVAAVVLGPASASEPVAALAQLDRKGIPSVVIDTTLDEQKLKEFGFKPKAFVGSDNRDGALKAARAIDAELKRRSVPPPYRVLVLEGNRVHQSAIDRADAFYHEAKLLGLESDGVRAEWSRSKAQDWTTQRFSSSRKPHAIFAGNDDMALGAVAALKSLRVDRAEWPVIIGFDYTEPAIKAIEAGDMFGSARQDPVGMGKTGVLFARQAANKDPALPSTPQYLPLDIFPQPK